MKPDMSKVVEWTKYLERAGSTEVDAVTITKHHQEAKDFLVYFKWCMVVLEEYVGFIYPGIVGVFLFRIRPARQDIDEWVWIIVGDLPPAYITCEESPNPATALDSYIGAMLDWVKAAERGEAVEHLIPVNVPATKENAERLNVRLKFLDDRVLSGYAEDLKER
jgi:hypothetical protein